MNAAERSQVHQALLSRRQAMADNWHKAIARTSFAPLQAVKVRQHLAELTEEIIAFLLTERFEHGRAEAIGASLANFHYIEPEALGRTQEILAQQLVEGLPADQVVELQPRLAALLGELATGFSQQARETVLAEQEWIHGALTRELRRVEEALRRERDLAEALVEAAAVVSSTLDHDQVLDHILEQVSRVVPSDAANIMLIEGDQVRVARWRGYKRFGVEEFISTIVFQVPEMPGFQQMIESGEPVTIPDTATYPGWVHLPATEWLRSYAAAPIVVRGEVIGFLNMDSATPGFFTQAHTQTLRAFAGQAAAAIENAQLYEAAKQELAERKRAEEELIRLSSAVKTSVDSIVIIDLEGKVIDVNEAALKMYGIDDKGDLIGQSILDFVAPGQREKGLAGIEFVLEKGYDTSRGYEVITKDGHRVPLELSASVMKDVDGKAIGIVIIARDITERQRAEEALRKAHDELEIRVEERTKELAKVNKELQAEITERKRAEEEIKQRNRELSTLNAIAATVNQSLNLEEVLSTALDKMLEATRLEIGAIRILNEQGGTLDLKVHQGVDLSPQIAERISIIRLAESRLAEAIATGEPLIVEELSSNPVVKLIGREDLKSLAVIPLRSKGRMLGTMEVVGLDPRQFTSEEIELLTSIGHQIGVAIENAMLYEKAQNSADQMASLFEIAQSLTSSLDMDRALHLIVEQAAKLLKTDICSLCLYDRDTDELLGQARCGASDEELLGLRVPLSQNQLAAEAKATLKPVVVEDTSRDHRVPAGMVEKWDIRSSLILPLVAEGRFLGVIFLETKAPRHFTAGEIELAQSFASQAAIALENAQLYAHSEELAISKERNRVAREIHDDLTQRLASLLMRVDLCLELIDEEPERAKSELDRMGTALQDGIQEARRSIFALRPLALERLGFHQALCAYVDDFAHQYGISIHVSLLEEGFHLPARVEYTLFRIVQEALANVRWHAQAGNVWIDLSLRSPGQICLEIRDDGHGFDMARRISGIPGDDDRGLGLLYMQERAEAMKGSFRMETEPTVGTKITATLPLES